MSEVSDLTLESCWVTPKSSLSYLEEACVNAEFKNNSNSSITIEDAICRFQTEVDLVPFEYHADKKAHVEPTKRVTVQIPFVVELELTSYTNAYSLSISYKRNGIDRIITTPIKVSPIQNFIMIYPLSRGERYFFISHKIPNDTSIATKLDHYLKKIGFRGFLAEDNPRPGLDIWTDKIMPAIKHKNCLGLIVIWDSKAEEDPRTIRKEIKYAKECHKKQIPLVERASKLPNMFEKSKEYQRSLDAVITETDLIYLAKSIDRTYRNGNFY